MTNPIATGCRFAALDHSGGHYDPAIRWAMQDLLTVYHDGSCPLCRLEIGHYRRQQGADRIQWVDVSVLEAFVGADLSRSGAMAKFHVRTPFGQLLSGAPAFIAVWELLPRWRWAASASKVPGMLNMLEAGYVLYLPIRPFLAYIVGVVIRT